MGGFGEVFSYYFLKYYFSPILPFFPFYTNIDSLNGVRVSFNLCSHVFTLFFQTIWTLLIYLQGHWLFPLPAYISCNVLGEILISIIILFKSRISICVFENKSYLFINILYMMILTSNYLNMCPSIPLPCKNLCLNKSTSNTWAPQRHVLIACFFPVYRPPFPHLYIT